MQAIFYSLHELRMNVAQESEAITSRPSERDSQEEPSTADPPSRILNKPTKLIKISGSQLRVQNIQRTLFSYLWCDHEIPILWAKGRTIYLNYQAILYSVTQIFADGSGNLSTSFLCRLPDNQTMRPDLVRVVMDSALAIETLRDTTEFSRAKPWIGQSTALAFNVCSMVFLTSV